MPLEYIIKQPKLIVGKTPLVLLIHGYGSNEQDLFSFSDSFPEHLCIVSVRAPHSAGSFGFAWYDINFNNGEKFNNIPQAQQSIDLLLELIDDLIIKYNLDKDNICLCGFSQGAILSYAIALKNPIKVKNIIALSGYMALDIIGEVTITEQHKALDFFVSHGRADSVIPIEWAKKTPILLTEMGIKHSYNEYHAGHQIAQQNFIDFMDWINDRMNT